MVAFRGVSDGWAGDDMPPIRSPKGSDGLLGVGLLWWRRGAGVGTRYRCPIYTCGVRNTYRAGAGLEAVLAGSLAHQNCWRSSYEACWQ